MTAPKVLSVTIAVGLLVLMITASLWLGVSAHVGYNDYFDNQAIGPYIDRLTRKGTKILLRWHKKFESQLKYVVDTLDRAEDILNNQYSGSNLFNLTAYTLQSMQPVMAKLDAATALLASLNVTNNGDGLVAFFKGSKGIINVGGAFNPGNRASGTFTVPVRGLYRITVRTGQAFPVGIDVMRNGNVTLTWLDHAHFYDVKTRIRLVWLNANDEIYCTGDKPKFFGVWLVRKQVLLPRNT